MHHGPSSQPVLTHHLLLVVEDEHLVRLLPETQRLVVRRRHDVVSVGTDGQTPDLRLVALRQAGG